MSGEVEQPTAVPSTEALQLADLGDLLGPNVRGPVAPEPTAPDPDEGIVPAPEQATQQPNLPQTAQEWIAAVEASPGRIDQVPGKFLKDVAKHLQATRDTTANQRAQQEYQRGRGEGATVAQQQAAFLKAVADIDQLAGDAENDPEAAQNFAAWQRQYPERAATYFGYKANQAHPQETQTQSPTAVIQAANEQLLTDLTANQAVGQRVTEAAQAGKYELDTQGILTAKGLTAMLRDAAVWLAQDSSPVVPKPDAATVALAEKQQLAADRGALPRVAGGGTPVSGPLTPARLKGLSLPEAMAEKKRDPVGYDAAVKGLSRAG